MAEEDDCVVVSSVDSKVPIWTHRVETRLLFLLLLLFLSAVCNCIVPMKFLAWEIRVAISEESQLRQSPATQPTVHAGCFSVFYNPPNSDMECRIFNVHTDVNVCDCIRGCTDTVRESALKVDSGRKILRCTGECVSSSN